MGRNIKESIQYLIVKSPNVLLIDGATNGSKRPLSAEMCRGCQSADGRGANGPRQLTGSNNGTGSQELLLLLEEEEREEVRGGQEQKKARGDDS